MPAFTKGRHYALLFTSQAIFLLNSCTHFIKYLAFICKILGTLICTRLITFIGGHKRTDKRREFVYTVLVFDFVIIYDTHFNARRNKCQFSTGFNTDHTEFETRTLIVVFRFSPSHFSRIGKAIFIWFVITIYGNLCIIKRCCSYSQQFQRLCWCYIEELTILAYTQIGKHIYHLVQLFFYTFVFCSLQCRIYFKW